MENQPNPVARGAGAAGPDPKPDRWRGVKIPWIGEVPLPPFALYCLAVLIVIAAGIKVYMMWNEVYAALSRDVERALAERHYNDRDKTEATVWQNTTGSLVVDYYNSDGAISVTRYSSDTRIPAATHWIADLAKIPLQPSPGNTSGGRLSLNIDEGSKPIHAVSSGMAAEAAGAIAIVQPREYSLTPRLVATLPLGLPEATYLFRVASLQSQHPQAGCGGRCLNPHPGPFKSWNGQVNGCFVQVWRQWPDGCTHYQWWNTCYNYWDPQIWWTCCVH